MISRYISITLTVLLVLGSRYPPAVTIIYFYSAFGIPYRPYLLFFPLKGLVWRAQWVLQKFAKS